MSDLQEMPLRPLIIVLGTTGVGKSKLAIELALRLSKGQHHGWLGARIINADAMQIYTGLDIITNKVPQAERQGIEHLLMSFKKPGEQYVVGQWVRDAVEIIEETHQRNQIPLVVGGTSYWIQHLMFPNRLGYDPTRFQQSDSSPEMSEKLAKSILGLPPDLFDLFQSLPEHSPSAAADPQAAFALHRLLFALDPTVASRWHWRDTRKVLRSLRIIKETGRQSSELLTEQSQITIKPRYRILCFWLYAEPSVLNPRLDARIDEMIKQDVLDEIRTLRNMASSSLAIPPCAVEAKGMTSEVNVKPPNFTQGIYQSIGYKEFYNHISSVNPTEGSFADAVQQMKQSTRQYAKRQISWIRNKLLPTVYAANTQEPLVHTYLLDCTELGEQWIAKVLDPAERITEGVVSPNQDRSELMELPDFLNQNQLPDPLTLSENARAMLIIDEKPTTPTSVLGAHVKVICPICTFNTDQPVMIESIEWEAHQNTRVHRRLGKKFGSGRGSKKGQGISTHVVQDDT